MPWYPAEELKHLKEEQVNSFFSFTLNLKNGNQQLFQSQKRNQKHVAGGGMYV